MRTPTDLALGDPALGGLAGVVPTWHPAYDDPTYRVLVAELGIPNLLSGPTTGPVVVGELADARSDARALAESHQIELS